jgi:glycogen(starch) synthase
MLPSVVSLIGLTWYVRRNQIRVVHCTEKPRDAVYGQIVAVLGGARCVIHVHVKAEDWISSGVRRAMSRAAALIGVSEFVAQSIRDMGYERSKVYAVLNGLELEEWEKLDLDPDGIRSEFGLASHARVIVSAARLFRHKGQHDLLAALPAVKERFPDVRVLIVGQDDPRGYLGEQSYSEVLRALCDELDLWGNVIFTGWRSDVSSFMAASDIYVMPSFEEPFGMVFIESMFLERPVVALDNGGTREVVEHGRSGLLSEPGDVDAIAMNIIRLLGDDESRRSMGRYGRQRVIDTFNAERMARDVERVYATLLATGT